MPGRKSVSSSGHVPLTMGTPHAAASNGRTLGEYPARFLEVAPMQVGVLARKRRRRVAASA
jgi:hypothetical protein